MVTYQRDKDGLMKGGEGKKSFNKYFLYILYLKHEKKTCECITNSNNNKMNGLYYPNPDVIQK